jgi:membrane-associated phospholipid phosphatase
LAQVLKSAKTHWKSAGPLWAVDKLMLGYLGATGVFILACWTLLPDALTLLVVHLGSVGLIVLASRSNSQTSWYFRNWYPLPLVTFCYREMAQLIPIVWGRSFDGLLADLDFAIWHANPTVWLERIQTPNFTEFLEIAYGLFVPAVLLVPALLWANKRFKEFRYDAFLIALGFLVSYVGYMLVPARGPRFLLAPLQHQALEGRWVFHWMRSTLDQIESAHYDCFPSGHVELTVLAWWMSRQISKWLGWTYFVYTLCIIFATVYLRYHYTVDLAAGALTAALLIVKAPALYRRLGGEGLPGSEGLSGSEGSVGT